MTGLQLMWAIVAAIGVLAIPGVVIGATLRLRGLWLAAAAPLLSVTAIGLAGMATSVLGVAFSVWPVLGSTVVLAGLAWLATIVLRIRPAAPTRGRGAWTVVAVGVGATLLGLRSLGAFPAPDLIAQSFDNVFHLAAARFITETGRASPWDITTLLRPAGQEFFYPSGWHQVVALVAEIAGAPVTIASNACLITIACIVWPTAVVLFTRTLFGGRTAVLVAAGVVSAGFATYPFMLIATLGTYPLVLSIALLPPAIAAAIEMTGSGEGLVARRAAGLVFAASLPALGVAHPSALVMLAVLLVPVSVVAAVRLAREAPHRARVAALSVALYVVLVLAMMLVLRTGITQPDTLRLSVAEAIGDVALTAYIGQGIPVAVALATILGVVTACRRRTRRDWLALGIWATASVLYVATIAGDEFIRLVVGGPWYVDPSRIAAFAPITVVPLAATGLVAAWDWFSGAVHRWLPGRPTPQTMVLTVAAVTMTATIVHSAPVRDIDAALRAMFTPTDNALTSRVGVGPDERRLVDLIEVTVPRDDVIANNPRDGSGFIYALTGRRLLEPHLLGVLDADQRAFYDGISRASPEDAACEVARRLDVRWIVEFHPGQLLSGDRRFDGINDIAGSPNVELVHKVGDSALYRIAGCGFSEE
ncbi:MAG: DUF6541 family protein [Microbacterium sp.]|uniref:DUF6541 family protein n=1 Tax=Microbacterium sp. TaxID=51671 RepID=UPI003F7E36CE